MEDNVSAVMDYLRKQEEKLSEIESLLTTTKTVLNINEVCKYTGLSKSTVYKLTHNGIIPFYKKCKHLYFDRAEIDNWLRSNKGYNKEEIYSKASTYITTKRGRA